MASIFWDSLGVIMIDYLEQGRTINGAYQAGTLRRLCQEIARKRWWKLTCGVLLLQDNVPANTSQVAMTVATECEFKSLPHPPYSPNMTPSDFYLFPKLKYHLRGAQYESNEGRKRVLGGPGNCLLFWRDKKALIEMDLVYCLEGRLYWKVMVKFSFPVSPNYKGPRSSWSASYSLIQYCLHICILFLHQRNYLNITQ